MRHIPDKSVDLVVTSPPYGTIRDYKNNWSLDLHSIGKEINRVLRWGGVACVVIQDGTKDFRKSLTTFRLALDWCDNIGLGLFETAIYQRDGRPGAWWNKRFRVDHEYILIFLKGYKPKSFDKEPLKIPAKCAGSIFHGTQRLTSGELVKIKKTVQKETKCRGTIWKYDASKSERNKLKNKHPAPFPDALAKDLILCFSGKYDIILDPMCGSGTTCVMADKYDRRFIGIDISIEYCEIAVQRLANEAVKE